jgi:ribosomal protein S16
MLKIRLQRVGRRNHAEFRVVLTEHARAAKSANYIARLGSYNPHTNEVSLDTERILEWVGKGARVSDTVHNLLVRECVITAPKKNVLPKKTAPQKEQEKATEKPAATGDAPASETASETNDAAGADTDTKESTKEAAPATDDTADTTEKQ